VRALGQRIMQVLPLAYLLVFIIPFVLPPDRHSTPSVQVLPKITDAHVTWYGVYQARDDAAVEDKSSFTKKRTISSGIVPPEINSNQIPAVLGSRFGFGFILSGAPTVVKLKIVRNFPAEGIRDSRTGERHFSEQAEYTSVNRNLFFGYIFDRDDELVPGLWSFEVWDDDRKLLEQSFTVYKP
jgi:Domain of unknown function (DUF3859)